jgi:hypothetical protein
MPPRNTTTTIALVQPPLYIDRLSIHSRHFFVFPFQTFYLFFFVTQTTFLFFFSTKKWTDWIEFLVKIKLKIQNKKTCAIKKKWERKSNKFLFSLIFFSRGLFQNQYLWLKGSAGFIPLFFWTFFWRLTLNGSVHSIFHRSWWLNYINHRESLSLFLGGWWVGGRVPTRPVYRVQPPCGIRSRYFSFWCAPAAHSNQIFFFFTLSVG